LALIVDVLNKRMNFKIKFIYSLFLLSFWVSGILPHTSKAQPPLKDLRVIGNSVNFQFITLDHFANGITLTGWTRLKIRYQYTTKDPWELRINALDNVIKYEGNPIYDIPLSQLELEATITSTNDASATLITPFVLSNLEQTFIRGNGLVPPAIVDLELSITYKLGVPPNIMLNKPEGLYFVGLRFLLVEQ